MTLRAASLPASHRVALAVLALACCAGLAPARPMAIAPALGAQLAAHGAGVGATDEEAAAARRLYGGAGGAALWAAAEDRRAALALLDDAADEGLEPADYGAAALRGLLQRGTGDSVAEAHGDIALTVGMLRYLADLRCGRTRGTLLSYRPAREAACDGAEALRAALGGRGFATLPADVAPSLAVYARLRTALQDYRERSGRGDTPVGKPAAQAANDGAAAALRQRLAELGDLAPERDTAGESSGAAGLDAAVKRFQHRHGLQEDGIAGPVTLAALNVPLRQRVRQIALAMERLRWLPPLPESRLVAINIPSFRLWTFDRAAHGAEPVLEMRVIVGRAVRTPTPVFVGSMRHVEFNPYWNVPSSILRSEILPRLAHDPAYLRRHQMEIVRGSAATQAVTAATLAQLRDGSLRLRQRPGPANALGAVKFVLPNPMNIYLHGTPARQLFDAVRRDFSHGCIRVEDPAALAHFVLGDATSWSAAAVNAAMAQGTTRSVALDVALPVVIFYATAVPVPSGTMMFFNDVYGLDALLERRWPRPPLAVAAAASTHAPLARVSGHAP